MSGAGSKKPGRWLWNGPHSDVSGQLTPGDRAAAAAAPCQSSARRAAAALCLVYREEADRSEHILLQWPCLARERHIPLGNINKQHRTADSVSFRCYGRISADDHSEQTDTGFELRPDTSIAHLGALLEDEFGVLDQTLERNGNIGYVLGTALRQVTATAGLDNAAVPGRTRHKDASAGAHCRLKHLRARPTNGRQL